MADKLGKAVYSIEVDTKTLKPSLNKARLDIDRSSKAITRSLDKVKTSTISATDSFSALDVAAAATGQAWLSQISNVGKFVSIIGVMIGKVGVSTTAISTETGAINKNTAAKVRNAGATNAISAVSGAASRTAGGILRSVGAEAARFAGNAAATGGGVFGASKLGGGTKPIVKKLERIRKSLNRNDRGTKKLISQIALEQRTRGGQQFLGSTSALDAADIIALPKNQGGLDFGRPSQVVPGDPRKRHAQRGKPFTRGAGGAVAGGIGGGLIGGIAGQAIGRAVGGERGSGIGAAIGSTIGTGAGAALAFKVLPKLGAGLLFLGQAALAAVTSTAGMVVAIAASTVAIVAFNLASQKQKDIIANLFTGFFDSAVKAKLKAENDNKQNTLDNIKKNEKAKVDSINEDTKRLKFRTEGIEKRGFSGFTLERFVASKSLANKKAEREATLDNINAKERASVAQKNADEDEAKAKKRIIDLQRVENEALKIKLDLLKRNAAIAKKRLGRAFAGFDLFNIRKNAARLNKRKGAFDDVIKDNKEQRLNQIQLLEEGASRIGGGADPNKIKGILSQLGVELPGEKSVKFATGIQSSLIASGTGNIGTSDSETKTQTDILRQIKILMDKLVDKNGGTP